MTDQGGREVGSEEGMDEVREKVEYRDTGIPKKDARFFQKSNMFLIYYDKEGKIMWNINF